MDYDQIIDAGYEQCNWCTLKKQAEKAEARLNALIYADSLIFEADTKSDLKVSKLGATITFHTNFYSSQAPSISSALGISKPKHFKNSILKISFDKVTSEKNNVLAVEVEVRFKDGTAHQPSQRLLLVCSASMNDATMIFSCDKPQKLCIKILSVTLEPENPITTNDQ